MTRRALWWLLLLVLLALASWLIGERNGPAPSNLEHGIGV